MSDKNQAKVSKWLDNNRKLAEKITDNKDNLADILNKVQDMKPENMGPVDGAIETMKELVQMVKDWKDKKYSGVSKVTIVTIVLCFVYFCSPVDIVPDVVPVAGLLDDVLVLKITLGQIGADLNRYREWRDAQTEE